MCSPLHSSPAVLHQFVIKVQEKEGAVQYIVSKAVRLPVCTVYFATFITCLLSILWFIYYLSAQYTLLHLLPVCTVYFASFITCLHSIICFIYYLSAQYTLLHLLPVCSVYFATFINCLLSILCYIYYLSAQYTLLHVSAPRLSPRKSVHGYTHSHLIVKITKKCMRIDMYF